MGFKYEINFSDSRPWHDAIDIQHFKNCGPLLQSEIVDFDFHTQIWRRKSKQYIGSLLL